MPPVFGNEMVDTDLGTLNISFRHLAWEWLGAVHTYAVEASYAGPWSEVMESTKACRVGHGTVSKGEPIVFSALQNANPV